MMEMEASQPDAGKKLWNIVRIVLFMLKKGKYSAGKAMSNLVFHHKVHDHLSSLSCRPSDVHHSFISPMEYEFSCSNSPAFYPHHHKRKHRVHNSRHHFRRATNYRYDDVTSVAAVQTVREMLNNMEAAEASPMVLLPGFGRSPLGRQLRVTDSPFPLKDEVDSTVLNKAADNFIKEFHRDLYKQQKGSFAFESPARITWGR